jgi:hypothetical protein
MEGILVDFRCVLRLSSDLPDLTAYLVGLSVFAAGSVLNNG